MQQLGKIGEEEILLIKILTDDNIKSINFSNINFDKLIVLFSRYLLLPTLYLRLKKNQILEKLPIKLVRYLTKIYEINFERNKIFRKEIFEIDDLFKNKKIEFLFLKTAALFKEKLFMDLGERMIGDIDFLVKDYEIERAVELLQDHGYQKNLRYKLWKTKHIPRLTGISKFFAVEPHTELLLYRKKNNLSSDEYFRGVKNNKIYYLAVSYILNSQINDYNFLFARIDYKCINDINNLTTLNSKPIFEKDELTNIYVIRFLMITDLLGITSYGLNYSFKDRLYIKRLILKKQNKVFRKIDNIICIFIKNIPIYFMQSIEFIINKNYRKNVISKLTLF